MNVILSGENSFPNQNPAEAVPPSSADGPHTPPAPSLPTQSEPLGQGAEQPQAIPPIPDAQKSSAVDVPQPSPNPKPLTPPDEPSIPAETAPTPVVALNLGSAPTENFRAEQLRARREKRAKRLQKLLEFARKKGSVDNDEIQIFLAVSDATAGRYAAELMKQGLLKKTGVGKYTRYSAV